MHNWWIYVHRSQGMNLRQINWRLIGRILNYARPYRDMIVLLFLTILVSTALGLVGPLVLRDMIDVTLPNKDFNRLLLLSSALVVVPIVDGLITVYQRKLNSTIGEGVIYDLRVSLFQHLQNMSLRFFTHTKTGELMSRMNNDVVGAQNAISNTIVNTLMNIIQIVAVVMVMVTIEWRLTLISIFVLPLFVWAALKLGSRLRDLERVRMGHNAQMNALMNETLNVGGALLVKLFGQGKSEVGRFDERAGLVRDIGVKRAVLGRWFFMIVGLVGAIGTALTYGIGGLLVLRDALTIGSIVALSVYVGKLYAALQALTTAPVEFATSMVSFERVFEVIDLDLEVAEKADAVRLDNVRGALIFDDVTFIYDQDDNLGLLSEVDRPGRIDSVAGSLSGLIAPQNGQIATSQARREALKNLSFTIEPGQLAALVGPSGAGKTTTTYLVPRLYDPSAGRVLLDGHDLRDLTLDTLSDHVGMVTQETHLFHDTIRTNLLYAHPNLMADHARASSIMKKAQEGELVSNAKLAEAEATIKRIEDELVQATKAANIYDFIMDLPEQLDTIVGERGYRLSGGEKQRIALARVILKDPRILVLDEATSHLDSQSEALIQDALGKVMAGRTSIVIAHRLSTILSADQIFVMDRGQIVERGTHEELLAMNGLYAELYYTQFKGEEAPIA